MSPLATGGGGCFCTGPDPRRSVDFDLASCDSHGKRAWQDDDSCFFPCAKFTAKREVRTKCPGGRVARPWSGAVMAARGCTCGPPSGAGLNDPLAPRPPGNCDEIPTADGADCVWKCE
jgi:hypothetical protein